MVFAWALVPISSLDEATEQGKALAAGTSAAGTTVIFGLIPLVAAHVIGLVVLGVIAMSGLRTRRMAMFHTVGAVAIASLFGLAIVMAVSHGELIVPTSR